MYLRHALAVPNDKGQDGLAPWWGDYELSSGQTGRWVIGPLSLWISNRDHEWRLAYLRDPDATLRVYLALLTCGLRVLE